MPALAEDLFEKLLDIRDRQPGLLAVQPEELQVFAMQLHESVRRHEYYAHVGRRDMTDGARDPRKSEWDPARNAVHHWRQGERDEACWLVFVATYFGRHAQHRWLLARAVYGALGDSPWTWARVSQEPDNFAQWLAENEELLRNEPTFKFGNHRKYETLRASSANGTASVVASYVKWVNDAGGSHVNRLWLDGVPANVPDPFDSVYQSLSVVHRLGRLARLDYLLMLRDLGFFPHSPRQLYLADNATGPLPGARRMFGSNQRGVRESRRLDTLASALANELGVDGGHIEDALCNWQKNPHEFMRFRG